MGDPAGPDRTDDSAFDRIVDQLDVPVFLVTTADGSERSGCLIGFATQSSIRPRRFLVCVSRANHTSRVARGATTFVVHVPRAGDRALADLFGEETGDEIDKFAHCAWREGPDGVPVLEGLDWFAGRVPSRTDVGDHDAFLIEPTGDGEATRGGPLLTMDDVRDMEAGHPAS